MRIRVRVTHYTVDLAEIERLLLRAEEQRNFMRVKESVIIARRLLLDVIEHLRNKAA